ncbi:hypothetical protein [Caudoviricetes sp.]|nr:hypothetical protein [Caudoviricetes sp.]
MNHEQPAKTIPEAIAIARGTSEPPKQRVAFATGGLIPNDGQYIPADLSMCCVCYGYIK